MSITKMSINGNEYTFVNHSRSNRSGFVHETELYKNDRLIGENKIQYYNRTWESYQYQSVMRGIVYALIDEAKESYKNAWKNAHGFKNLTETRRKALQEDFEKNPPENYEDLAELLTSL